MEILHISTTDCLGGAAIAALRLHQAMLSSGLKSKMLVARKSLSNQNNSIYEISPFLQKLRYINRIPDYLNSKRFQKNGLYTTDLIGINVINNKLVQNADVVYIHYINGFLSISQLEKFINLASKKKIVFVLHDMWLLTGGCHHSFSCDKYTNQCSNCSIIKSNLFKDFSYYIHLLKKKKWCNTSNIYIISPSTWMQNNAQRSSLFSNSMHFTIPNPIDENVFFPSNKKIAKEKWNIPIDDKPIILFGAIAGVNNPYKGWTELKKALNSLPADYCYVIVFGSIYSEEIVNSLDQKVIFAGHIKEEKDMALLYNAADAFVAPSLADNLPSTLIESMMCGIPVVSFYVGGIPDIVSHKMNGYLAKYRDSEDLALGIQWVLSHYNELSLNAIKSTKERFKTSRIIDKHKLIIGEYGNK